MSRTVSATSDHELLDEVRRVSWGAPWDPRSVVHTGSDLRRVEVAGQTVVIKRLDRRGDWLSRSTNGVGRALQIWRSGLLGDLQPVVEHGVIGVIEEDEHDALVMHDLSEWLIPPNAWVDHDTIDTVLGCLARVHEHAANTELEGLCTTFERANYCNPSFHAADTGPNPVADGGRRLSEGFEYIVSKLGTDAGAFVSSFYDNARALADEVDHRTSRRTLLHGDAKLENLGVHDERLVAVDWGELTGVGPPEIDVVRFALGTCWFQTDLTPTEVYDRYDGHSTVPLDERQLELSTRLLFPSHAIGCLGTMGRLPAGDLRERAKARFFGMLAEFERSFH